MEADCERLDESLKDADGKTSSRQITYIMFVIIFIVGKFYHTIGALQHKKQNNTFTGRPARALQTSWNLYFEFLVSALHQNKSSSWAGLLRESVKIPEASLGADGSAMLTECFRGSTISTERQHFYSLAAQNGSSHTHASLGCVFTASALRNRPNVQRGSVIIYRLWCPDSLKVPLTHLFVLKS